MEDAILVAREVIPVTHAVNCIFGKYSWEFDEQACKEVLIVIIFPVQLHFILFYFILFSPVIPNWW